MSYNDLLRQIEELKRELERLASFERATGGGGGGGAPDNAQYVTLATNVTLTNERVATAGANIAIADAGAGSTATFAVSPQGTGSALDADLLDGSHLSALLLKASNLSDIANAATAFSNIKQAATDAATGVVELATQAETDAGTDTGRAIVPATLMGNPRFLPCDGRLTLTSGAAITTSDVTAATTIYFTPFKGNRIALYTGSVWLYHAFTERSLSLAGFTANKNNDVFIYDNAGTLTLERVEWTNDSTRATALATQDGRVVKSGDATRLYLGTFRTTSATGQTEDSQTARYCWNYYNRTLKDATVANNTSHTYDSATVRAFNAGAMFTSGLAYVVGIVQEVITASLNGQITRLNTDSAAALGIGTVSTAHAISSLVGGNFNGAIRANLALLPILPTQGYNELWITESGGNTAGDPTFASGRLLVTLFC